MDKKLFSLLFFLSGASGLVYEILWTRLFSFALGNTYLTISIIVASFMFGLFLGAWLVGRFIEKCRNELRWYAVLEFVIGGFALLLLLGYGFVETVYHGLYAVLGRMELLYSFGKGIATLIFIVIPTSAMGATLPLVVQYFTKQKKFFGDNISLFYTINTIGGALGALAAGFYLIENLGIKGSLFATAVVNMLIGVTVLFVLRKGQTPAVSDEYYEEKRPKARRKKSAKPKEEGSKILYLTAAGLAGFAALAYEIMWTRGLKFLIHNSTYSFSVILFIFLAGIAIGSFFAKKLLQQNVPLHFVYGLLQIILGLSALFAIYLLYSFSYTDFFQKNVIEIIYDYSYNWLWAIAIYALVCGLMFLIPATAMGILFPLINALFYENVAKKAGQTVSAIYAINTIGSIAGSLAAGFFLLPTFGIKTGIILVSLINLGLGMVFIYVARIRMLATVSVSAVIFLLMTNLAFDGKYLLGRNEKKEDSVPFYKEGLMATVKVFERRGDLYMSIDGITIASTHRALLKKEKLIGHLPFFVKPDIKKALAVGLASGISVGSMALHENVEQIDCVELIKPVFPAATHFSAYNFDIFNNSKINLIHDDIYGYMKRSREEYDLISSDGKLGPLYAGNTIMLARDYYELCKARMKKDGLFIQWVPITTPHNELKIILDTLKQSFRHVALFFIYPTDVFMLASEAPVILDKSYMGRVFSNSAIKRDLASFGIQEASSLFSSFIGLYESDANAGVVINSFDRPVLEFAYMRDWKKSRRWQGGYRAKNLEYLAENYEKSDLNLISSMFKHVEQPMVESTFQASLLFFKGAVKYFRTGNLRNSFQEYMKFKEGLQLPLQDFKSEEETEDEG